MMPSATSPTTSSGWREFLRVIRLSSGEDGGERAEAGDPQRRDVGNARQRDVVDDDPGEEGARGQHQAGDERDEVRAHARAEDSARDGSLRVLPFLVPRHLDRLELRLVRRLRVVVEAVEREHVLAQIGEADRQRIDVRETSRRARCRCLRRRSTSRRPPPATCAPSGRTSRAGCRRLPARSCACTSAARRRRRP